MRLAVPARMGTANVLRFLGWALVGAGLLGVVVSARMIGPSPSSDWAARAWPVLVPWLLAALGGAGLLKLAVKKERARARRLEADSDLLEAAATRLARNIRQINVNSEAVSLSDLSAKVEQELQPEVQLMREHMAVLPCELDEHSLAEFERHFEALTHRLADIAAAAAAANEENAWEHCAQAETHAGQLAALLSHRPRRNAA